MKLIKHLLRWRKRYYLEKNYADNADSEVLRLKEKLNTAYRRYNDAITHNSFLAKEVDSLYRIIEKFKETPNE